MDRQNTEDTVHETLESEKRDPAEKEKDKMEAVHLIQGSYTAYAYVVGRTCSKKKSESDGKERKKPLEGKIKDARRIYRPTRSNSATSKKDSVSAMPKQKGYAVSNEAG